MNRFERFSKHIFLALALLSFMAVNAQRYTIGNETAATTMEVTIYFQNGGSFGNWTTTVAAGAQTSWTYPSSNHWITNVKVGPVGGNFTFSGCSDGIEDGNQLLSGGNWYCVVYNHPNTSPALPGPNCALGVKINDSTSGAACP